MVSFYAFIWCIATYLAKEQMAAEIHLSNRNFALISRLLTTFLWFFCPKKSFLSSIRLLAKCLHWTWRRYFICWLVKILNFGVITAYEWIFILQKTKTDDTRIPVYKMSQKFLCPNGKHFFIPKCLETMIKYRVI